MKTVFLYYSANWILIVTCLGPVLKCGKELEIPAVIISSSVSV